MPKTAAQLHPVPTQGVIERGVPMPTSYTARNSTANAIRKLYDANVGDSVFFAYASPGYLSTIVWKTGGRGWATVRKVEGGYRVWKVA